MKTCQHWDRVREMDAPGAWVHRVGINLAISRARRRRTEERVARTEGARQEPAPGADTGVGDTDVWSAVADLPPDERAVVVLRFHADLSVLETASALGVPEGTVKTRTRRALARLRDAGLDTRDALVEVES